MFTKRNALKLINASAVVAVALSMTNAAHAKYKKAEPTVRPGKVLEIPVGALGPNHESAEYDTHGTELPSVSAVQSTTTRYEQLKTRLQLKPGKTYLQFMVDTVNPELNKFQGDIDAVAKADGTNYKKYQTDLIARGAGVAIRIDSKNYFFNVGYNNGSDPKNDVKSGRSYGVGPTNRQSDPSDVFYLGELARYYKSEPQNVGKFFDAIMKVLANCDTSGWAELSEQGQIVATDFMAIYTAESDRHIMVHLRPNAHPWEIDLATATFVSQWVAISGTTVDGGQVKSGDPVELIKGWWAQGTAGSGIGETRRDRLALQHKIADLETKSNGSGINEIERLIGDSKDNDVIQGVFEYLNSPIAAQRVPTSTALQLKDKFLSYMSAVAKDAKEKSLR